MCCSDDDDASCWDVDEERSDEDFFATDDDDDDDDDAVSGSPLCCVSVWDDAGSVDDDGDSEALHHCQTGYLVERRP